jgi:hypothetical protein
MKYISGEQYCGDFVADMKEGKGILSHFDTVINGVWKGDCLIMGQHKQVDGVYFGSFDENKLPTGKGIFSYENGYIYQGKWKNGLQHGWGTFKDDTSIYEGLWENGNKTEGTLKFEEGDVYVGSFINGMKECGVLTYKNGDEFSGEFNESRRFMGVMTFKATGDVYRGEFNETGLFHGGGDLKSAEGD